MKKPAILGILGLWGTLAACPSHTLLTIEQQQRVQQTHRSQEGFLKQSFFVGPFFVYDDRFYVCERAFDERVLIENPGGDPILPAEPLAILPMGTKMRLLDVEFANSSAIADRKLKSPRHFTWVSLQRVDPPADKPYILVLTQEFHNEKEFDSALAQYLLAQDPRPEFAGAPPEVLAAIDQKRPLVGMRADALLRARGYPDKVAREVQGSVRVERWQYAPGRVVVLKDDVVDSFEGFPPAAPATE